jgi:hypothetical protein
MKSSATDRTVCRSSAVAVSTEACASSRPSPYTRAAKDGSDKPDYDGMATIVPPARYFNAY